MYGLITYAALAVTAVSSVSGYIVPRASPPKGWLTNYLEDYQVYHTRYLALECQNKHKTSFFDACCHPLLATETLASARPKQCIPSASASASASAAEPTSTVTTPGDGDDDDDCDDEPTSTTTQLIAKPTTTKATTVHKVTTTTHKPTTTTHKPTTTKTTAKPTTTTKSGSGSGIGVIHTGGFATFFEQGGVKGACEHLHKDSDFVVALDSRLYGNTGRVSPDCGRQVLIKNPANGHTVKAIVADACPTCETKQSLDLSHAAFKALAAFSVGMMPITWEFTT